MLYLVLLGISNRFACTLLYIVCRVRVIKGKKSLLDLVASLMKYNLLLTLSTYLFFVLYFNICMRDA